MFLNVSQTVGTVVTSMLDKYSSGEALIVSIRTSYMFHFSDAISIKTVDNLQELFPDLDFCEHYAEASSMYELMFINRGGYYICLSNILPASPSLSKHSVWSFESDHDSCWRSDAFDGMKRHDSDIRSMICDVAETIGLERPTPGSIVPNFSIIDSLDTIKIDNVMRSHNSNGKHGEPEYHLFRDKDNNQVIAEDRLDQTDFVSNA